MFMFDIDFSLSIGALLLEKLYFYPLKFKFCHKMIYEFQFVIYVPFSLLLGLLMELSHIKQKTK